MYNNIAACLRGSNEIPTAWCSRNTNVFGVQLYDETISANTVVRVSGGEKI